MNHLGFVSVKVCEYVWQMEVDGATSAVENRIGWVAASPPPPLLKQLPPVQPPSQLDNINKQIPPVLHQAIK